MASALLFPVYDRPSQTECADCENVPIFFSFFELLSNAFNFLETTCKNIVNRVARSDVY